MTVKIIERTPSAYSYPLLIRNLLSASLFHSSDQEIIYGNKLKFTYKTFSERVAQLAQLLDKIGVKQGSRVGFMDWNSHRYLEAYFAVPMTGAILHAIDTQTPIDQLVYIINHAEDDVLFVNNDFLTMLEQIKNQIKTVKTFIVLTDADQLPDNDFNFFGEYESLIENCTKDYIFEDFSENAVAILFYHPNNHFLPNGICLSHRQVVLQTYGALSGLCAYDDPLRVKSNDIYMPLSPMYQACTWGMPYLFTMLGSKQVYPGRISSANIIELVCRHKVTFSDCSPVIARMLLDAPLLNDTDLDGWRLIIEGSSTPKKLFKHARKKGLALYAAYGVPESGPLLTISKKTGSQSGYPLPNVQIELIGRDGTPLPPNSNYAGEVVLRSPWLAQGYYKDDKKSEVLWRDGWLHTGDIGKIDSRGYLNIINSIKNEINVGDTWETRQIYKAPKDIEPKVSFST